jgi:hypothetical protein
MAMKQSQRQFVSVVCTVLILLLGAWLLRDSFGQRADPAPEPTPGEHDRAARRIVTGGEGQYYWTEEHRPFAMTEREQGSP